MDSSISRRGFIGGAAVGVAGLTGAGAALGKDVSISAAGDTGDASRDWDYQADVVIVGFGGAGAVSAVTAHDAGAEVIILEKQARDTDEQVNQTNSTRLSHSCMMDFHDRQGALDFLKVACRGATPDDVMEEFSKYMVGTAEWVNGIGGKMYASPETDNSEYPFDVLPEGENYTAWLSDGLGPGYWEALEDVVTKRDIQVLFETPAQRLVTDDAGAVVGVEALGPGGAAVRVGARKGVILCCGGFEFDFDMQHQFLLTNPCRFNGNPDNTGDGIKMAQEVGADLWHTALIGGEPIGYIEENRHGISFYGKPSVWVDKYGRRFAGGPTSVNNFTPGTLPNHSASYACIKWDFEKCDFSAVPFFTVFDQSTIDAGGIIVMDWLGVVKKDYTWSADLSAEVEKGWILKADTLEELATMMAEDPDDAGRMDPETLATTIDTFNKYCAQGEDPEFHVVADGLMPLANPPYYAMKMYPGCWNTFGGPRRDPRGRVLDTHGNPIKGLFGAGECGSVLGFLYAGGGWNIMEGVASGRIAGEEAAAQ